MTASLPLRPLLAILLALALARADVVEDFTQFENQLIKTFSQEVLTSAVNYTEDVKFYLFLGNSSGSVERILVDEDNLLDAGWRSMKGVKIIVHGYERNINSSIFYYVGNAYVDTGFDGNVIGVDWSALAYSPFYVASRYAVKGVGERIATLVDYMVTNNLTSIDQVHLIGHSLGAHVVGNCGKSLQSNWGITPGRITGLDPAAPLFEVSSFDSLAKTDGELVDVIHTCGYYLGLMRQVGDYDFYPNGGHEIQPGCTLEEEIVVEADPPTSRIPLCKTESNKNRYSLRSKWCKALLIWLTSAPISGIDMPPKSGPSCSHARAYKLFGEAIRNTSAFESVLCSSWLSASNGLCYGPVTAYMGQEDTYTQPGPFYLRTAASSPYSL